MRSRAAERREPWYDTGSTPKQKFTSYERDTESGNDYAMARSYGSRMGRFSSPDPLAGSPADPQSLNRYTYARNDPVNSVDPLGLHWEPILTNCRDWLLQGGESSGVAQICSFQGWIWAPDEPPPVGPPTEGGEQSGGASGAIAAFKAAAQKISEAKLEKKKCLADLAAMGLTADQLRQGAASANFLDGIGSTVPRSDLYASSPVPEIRAQAAGVKGTVGAFFSNNPGVVAQAQLGGHAIYLNASLIKPAEYWDNVGTVAHEVVHNVTGLTDPDLQRKLGLNEQKDTSNIAKKLLKDCF